jgi:hypothetical protein
MKKVLALLLSVWSIAAYIPVSAQSVARISISPDISCLQQGENVIFTAQGYDEAGNLIQGASFDWLLSGVGSIDSSSGQATVYRATRDGLATITARSGAISASVRFSVGGGKVSNVRVRVDNDIAGQVADYYIYFETDECGMLEAGDKIYIAFPSGTQLPSYYQCSAVAVNGIRAQYEIRESTDRSKSPVLVITVPNHFRRVTSISVWVCKVVNPRGGNCYVLAVATSKQTQWVLSTPFSIRGSIITPPMVEVKPDIAGETASYKITFKSSNSGRLSGCYGSFIMVEFPFGTKMPKEFLPEHILVNKVPSCPHIKPEINGRTVKLFPQMVVIEDSDVVVEFLLEAGIGHPDQPGDYQVAVWTSSDTIRVLSRSYKIRASSIEDVQVVVDKPYIQTLSAYTIRFKTGLVGKLNPGALITIYFPSSMTLPDHMRPGSIRINGAPTIRSPIVDGRSILRIPVPIEIEARSQVEIVISEEFGLINPPDPRRYHVDVQTAKEGTLVKSNEFVIGPSVVGDVSIRLSMPYIGVTSTVELSFVTGGGGKMLAGKDRIYIVFPKGTHIPNAISRASVTIQGEIIPVTPFIKKEIMEIMLHVPVDIPAESRVVVRFDESAALMNPLNPGFYKYQIATSREVSYIESPPIEITESTVRNVTVQMLQNTIMEKTWLKLHFHLGDAGNLEKNDRITCFFDPAFILPVTIDSGIMLNGVPVKTGDVQVDQSKWMISIKTNEAFTSESLINIEFLESAGILNPKQPGNHTLGVATSKEQRTISSAVFKIIPLPLTNYSLDPLQADGQKDWYITEPVLTLMPITEAQERIQTFVSINEGPWLEYLRPLTFSSGEHQLSFFSQHSDSAKEEIQKITFRVDTQAPIIQLPEQEIYTNQKSYMLSLTIIESWFDYALVNEHRIESLMEGKISVKLDLGEGVNEVLILVYDQAGHRTEELLTIVLDTVAPKLELLEPSPWSRSIRKNIWVSGNTDPDVVLVCNDIPLEHDQGYFEAFIPLMPGLNALNFVAIDQAGNERKYTLPVQYAANFRAEIFIDTTRAETSFGEMEFEAESFIEQGYSMVPLRIFAELMGFKIEFEPVFQIITLKEPAGKTIVAQVGNTTFTVDDQKKILPVPPLIRNGRSFVPLRFFAEEFGFEVSYHKERHSVLIQYHESD